MSRRPLHQVALRIKIAVEHAVGVADLLLPCGGPSPSDRAAGRSWESGGRRRVLLLAAIWSSLACCSFSRGREARLQDLIAASRFRAVIARSGTTCDARRQCVRRTAQSVTLTCPPAPLRAIRVAMPVFSGMSITDVVRQLRPDEHRRTTCAPLRLVERRMRTRRWTPASADIRYT